MKITLLFPNDKSITLEGDSELVNEAVAGFEGRMDGFVKYTRTSYSEASEWNLEALKKILEQEKSND